MSSAIERAAQEELERESRFILPDRRKIMLPAAPTVYRADELLRRKFDPIRWAIRDMLPEGVSMLVGPPKVGKSWLTLQFAIAVSDGSPIWNGRPAEASGEVLLLGLEDNDRRMQSRIAKLRASNADMTFTPGGTIVRAPDVSRLHYATEWPRMDQGGLDHLRNWLTDHPDARMVIVDTLGRFRAPETGRGSAYQSDYAVGAALKPLADHHGVAIVLIHHTRKMAATDVLDTVSGTQGLTGSVDALLLLRRERGQLDAALYVTGRDIEREEDYALQFHAESCTWSALGTVREATRTRERQAIVDFITKNGPSKPKDITEGLGKKGAAVRRLLQKMFADDEVRVDDGHYSLIHTYGNSGNKGNEDHSGHTGDTLVTSATDVTCVTAVTTPMGRGATA